MGKYVENRVNYNDRIAFFCEDKADMNELLQVLREEKGLAINVAHSPPSHEPLSVEYQPRMAISDLRYHLSTNSTCFLNRLLLNSDDVVF